MRQAKVGGNCAECGKCNETGIFWFSPYKVLDFGNGVLFENSMRPELCDRCQCLQTEKEREKC